MPAAAVFFRLGVGILHSMEKATQLVHGTPKLAASHRTYIRQPLQRIARTKPIANDREYEGGEGRSRQVKAGQGRAQFVLPFLHGMSVDKKYK